MILLDGEWIPFARNEYRLITSSIRSIRSYLPYLLTGSVFIFIFFLAPNLVNTFLDDFHAFILSQVALVLVQYIQLMIFFLFVGLPIASTIQDMKSNQLELIFSAPIKPSNLLLGEFLGKLPFYATFAAIIGGLFTAALTSLKLDVFQVTVILFIFIINFLTATWIGTACGGLLRSILSKTARGRDIGKGVAILIMIPPVVLFYAFMGGFLESFKDPEIAKIFNGIVGIFPFFWGAEVIVSFAFNPGNFFAIEPEMVLRLIGLVSFFLAILWIGGKLSNRIYNLEPTSFGIAKANPKSRWYRWIYRIFGFNSFTILLSASLKNYFRKMKNITMLAYFIGLVVIMQLMMSLPEDPEAAFISNFFLGPLLAGLFASDVTLQGKENLLLYKQSPTSTLSMLKVKFAHYLLTMVPIIITINIAFNFVIYKLDILHIGLNLFLIILISSALILFNIGLFLCNPAYDEQKNKGEYMINFQISVFLVMIPFFILLISLDNFLYDLFGIVNVFYYAVGVFTLFIYLIALIVLFLGVRKLGSLE